METSIKELKVDISNSGRIQGTVTAMQGDNKSRYLKILILNNGKSFNINGLFPVVRGTKADGKTIFNNCTVENGNIIVELTSQMLAAPGIAHFEIALYESNPTPGVPGSGGSSIASFPFDINVIKSAFNVTNMTSTDEFKVIEEIVENIELLANIDEYFEKIDTLDELVDGHSIKSNVPANAVFTDTTYDFSTGDSNGQIKVTPSNGSAQNISVKGLGTAAYKNIPSSGNASTAQVVMGNDTRLTDSRNAKDVSAWAKAATKPTYTASEVGAIASSLKGAANGVAELDSNGLVLTSQLPSFVDDVLEYTNKASFPTPGIAGKIYVDLSTNLIYRWGGSEYTEISPSLALGETSSTAYRGDHGKTAYTHATDANRLTTAISSGLYKVASTKEGHIASLTAVTKSDITGLGIPAQDTTYSDATQSTHGLMSIYDKKKLDGVSTGAEVNQNAFSNVKVGSTTITADSKTDTLEMVGGNYITITPDATNDKMTISHNNSGVTAASKGDTSNQTPGFGSTFKVPSGTVDAQGHLTAFADHTVTIPSSTATTSANGLMSSTDKAKLDGISSGAEANVQSDWNQTNTSADDYIKNKPSNLVSDANYVHTDNNYTMAEKTKLSGISANAKKVSASTTNGNIQIDDTETQVYDDSEIQGDLSTAVVEAEASNTLTFTTRSAQSAQSAEIVLEPIQDLHGYDHPWPAGGGKNKFDQDTIYSSLKTGENTFSGTASAINQVLFSIPQELVGQELTFSVHITSTEATSVRVSAKVGGENINGNAGVAPYWSILTFTPMSTNDKVQITFGSNSSGIIVFDSVQLEKGSSRTTWNHYSNICPISGHTEVSVKGCGKNLFDFDSVSMKSIDTLVQNRAMFTHEGEGNYTLSTNTDSNIDTIYWNIYDKKTNAFINSNNRPLNKGFSFVLADEQTFVVWGYNGMTINQFKSTIPNVQLELGSTATEYEPYTPSNDLTKDLGQEVFGASYNPVSGELVVMMGVADLEDVEWTRIVDNLYVTTKIPNIKYTRTNTEIGNGLAEKYKIHQGQGMLVQTGCIAIDVSQVSINDNHPSGLFVYELATPITYHLSPDEIKLLSGVNTVWTDGTSIKIAYRDGKVATLADLQEISDSPFKIVNGALCWISNK